MIAVCEREAHPQYKHGEKTQEAIEVYRHSMLQLQDLETLAYATAVIRGPRTKGRKQNRNGKIC
jgi:hypothetical protein